MPFHSWIPDAAVDAPAAVHGLPARQPSRSCSASTSWPASRWTCSSCSPDSLGQHAADDRRRRDDPAGRHDGAGPEGLQAAALVPRHQPGRLHDPRHRHGRAGRHRRRPVPHDQPRHVQELPVPDRRLGGEADRHDRPREARRPGRRMPVTFVCFFVAAASISGVPPFNGFFSKELVYDGGAGANGWIFYIAAVLGSFFTAAPS